MKIPVHFGPMTEPVRRILEPFEHLPLTEEATYLRYMTLCYDDLRILGDWMGEDDCWRRFKCLCALRGIGRHFAVRRPSCCGT